MQYAIADSVSRNVVCRAVQRIEALIVENVDFGTDGASILLERDKSRTSCTRAVPLLAIA